MLKRWFREVAHAVDGRAKAAGWPIACIRRYLARLELLIAREMTTTKYGLESTARMMNGK